MSKKNTRTKQQKITSMLTSKQNNVDGSEVCRQEKNNKMLVHARQEKNERKTVSWDFSDEDECNLPITFADFETYTNINLICKKTIQDLFEKYKEKYANKNIQDSLENKRYLSKYAKVYYKIFYTRPEDRSDENLYMLRLTENAPSRVRSRFYKIPQKYIHRLKNIRYIKKKYNVYIDDAWKADCKNPQPSTSSRTVQLFQKKPEEDAQYNLLLTVATALINSYRDYRPEVCARFPVDIETFERLTHSDATINNIIRVATQGDDILYEKLKNNQDIRESTLRQYYYDFYENPKVIRRLFPICLKAAPSFIKNKIMSLPSPMNNSSIGQEFNNNEDQTSTVNINSPKEDSQLSRCNYQSPHAPTRTKSPFTKNTTHNDDKKTPSKIEVQQIGDNDDIVNIPSANTISAECPKTAFSRKRSHSIFKNTNMPVKGPKRVKTSDINRDEVIDASQLDITNDDYEQFKNNMLEQNNLDTGNLDIMADQIDENNLEKEDNLDTANLDIMEDHIEKNYHAKEDNLDNSDIAEDVNDSFIDILKKFSESRNIKNVKSFPVTFREFLGNTNVLWLLKDKMNISSAWSENVEQTIKSLAYNWYVKYFTEPNFRNHKMMEYLYLRYKWANKLSQYAKDNIVLDDNANESLSENFNTRPEDITSNIMAEMFLKPIENLQLYEKAFPLTLEQFKNFVLVEKSLTEIIKSLAKNDEQQITIMQQNKELCERIIINCYVLFYKNRMFSDKFQLHIEKHNLPFFKEDQQFCASQTIETATATTTAEIISTRENVDEEEETEELSTEELSTEKIEEPAEIIKYHKKSLCVQLLQSYIGEKVRTEQKAQLMKILEPLIPRPKAVQIQSVKIIRQGEKAYHTAEEIYFQKLKRDHTLRFMLRKCTGNKQKVLRAILDMTFVEFYKYTHIYNGANIYKNLALIKRCYKYTIVNKLIWPTNLYICLDELIKYLSLKCEPFDNLKLEDISPKLLHFIDLWTCTDFSKCVYKHNCLQFNKLPYEEVLKCNDAFYKRCWLMDNWGERVPRIKEILIIQNINKFKLAAVKDLKLEEAQHLWLHGEEQLDYQIETKKQQREPQVPEKEEISTLQSQQQQQQATVVVNQVKEFQPQQQQQQQQAQQHQTPSKQGKAKTPSRNQEVQVVNQVKNFQQQQQVQQHEIQSKQDKPKPPSRNQETEVVKQLKEFQQQQRVQQHENESIQDKAKTPSRNQEVQVVNQVKHFQQQQRVQQQQVQQHEIQSKQDKPKPPSRNQETEVVKQLKEFQQQQRVQQHENESIQDKAKTPSRNQEVQVVNQVKHFQQQQRVQQQQVQQHEIQSKQDKPKPPSRNQETEVVNQVKEFQQQPMVSINFAALESILTNRRIIRVQNSTKNNATDSIVLQSNPSKNQQDTITLAVENKQQQQQPVLRNEPQLTQNITLGSGSTNENTSLLSSIPNNVPCSTQKVLIQSSPNLFGSSGSGNETGSVQGEVKPHDAVIQENILHIDSNTTYDENEMLNISRDPLSTQNVLQLLNNAESQNVGNIIAVGDEIEIKQEPIPMLNNLYFSMDDDSIEKIINIRPITYDDIIELSDDENHLSDELLVTQNNTNNYKSMGMQTQEGISNTQSSFVMQEAQHLTSNPDVNINNSAVTLEDILYAHELEQQQLHTESAITPPDVIINNSEEDILNVQKLEQQQLHTESAITPPKTNLPCQNVTVRKKRKSPTVNKTKTGDFAPQLTHDFRPLPTRPVTKNLQKHSATTNIIRCTNANVPRVCSASQDLSNDLTLFNNTNLLQMIDQPPTIRQASIPIITKIPRITISKNTTQATRKSSRKTVSVTGRTCLLKKTINLEAMQVDNNNTNDNNNENCSLICKNTAMTTTTQPVDNMIHRSSSSSLLRNSSSNINSNNNEHEEFICYRRLLRFDYFNALTIDQMTEYEIPVHAYGQTHMQALIHDGRQIILVYGDILCGLFSYYKPFMLQNMRQLLSSLDEFHFNRNTEQIASRNLDDARVRTLTLLMQYSPPLTACKFYFHNAIRENAHCKALRNVKHCSQMPPPYRDLSLALRSTIVARMLELKNLSNP